MDAEIDSAQFYNYVFALNVGTVICVKCTYRQQL